MYSDYDFYVEHKGKLTETEYNNFVEDAYDFIDSVTRGQAATAPVEMQSKLKRCECKLVDVLFEDSTIPMGIISESNDGVSISYSPTTHQDAQSECQRLCKMYLSFPTNLIFTGVDKVAT